MPNQLLKTSHDNENRRYRHIALAMAIGIHAIAMHVLFPGSPLTSIPASPNAERPALSVQLFPRQADKPAISTSTSPSIATSQARVTPRMTETNSRISPQSSSDSQTTTSANAKDAASEQNAAAPASAYPPISAEDILQSMRRDIGKIDRELRQAYPVRPKLDSPLPQSRFEQALSAAGVQRSLETETITLVDGRKMTRVKGPNGTYCVISEVSNGSDGRDSMKDGIRSKTVNCPS
jgi:hypothetical protein